MAGLAGQLATASPASQTSKPSAGQRAGQAGQQGWPAASGKAGWAGLAGQPASARSPGRMHARRFLCSLLNLADPAGFQVENKFTPNGQPASHCDSQSPLFQPAAQQTNSTHKGAYNSQPTSQRGRLTNSPNPASQRTTELESGSPLPQLAGKPDQPLLSFFKARWCSRARLLRPVIAVSQVEANLS